MTMACELSGRLGVLLEGFQSNRGGSTKVKTVIEAAGLNKRKYPAGCLVVQICSEEASTADANTSATGPE